MNRALVSLVLLALPAFAQERRVASVDDELQKNPTYQFQFVTSASRTVDFVQALINNAAHLQYYPALNMVIIRAYNAGDADKVIALLKKYDVPKPEVELTAYMVMSLPSGNTWSGGKPVPADLQSAIEQMKQTLGDRVYSLRDIVQTPATDGASMESALPDTMSATYSLEYDQVTVSREAKSAQIGQFRFSIKQCPADTCKPLSISNLGVVIQEGQKLVFGRLPVIVMTKTGQTTADLYLVLTARIKPGPKP